MTDLSDLLATVSLMLNLWV